MIINLRLGLGLRIGLISSSRLNSRGRGVSGRRDVHCVTHEFTSSNAIVAKAVAETVLFSQSLQRHLQNIKRAYFVTCSLRRNRLHGLNTRN